MSDMRRTAVKVSEQTGLTWRQYKCARAWLKKHAKKKNMTQEQIIKHLTAVLPERKHRWDNA